MATWKKVIMEDSAAALSSLTLTTALAIAQGGTGATSAANARTALGLGSAAQSNTSAFATGAEGDLATSAQQPPTEGAFADGDKTKLDGIEASATADQTPAQLRTAIGTGNGNLVPAAAATTHFLRGDGTFQDISSLGATLTEDQVDDFAAAMFTDATHTGITSTYNDTAGTVTLAVAGTYLNSNVTPATLGLTIGTNTQAYDAGLASIAGLTTAANKMIYATGADTYAVTSLTAAARNLLDDASSSAMRTTLGVVNNVNMDVDASLTDVFDASGNEIDVVAPASSGEDYFVVYDDSASKLTYNSRAAAKTLLALSNVNDTSDANKPVSTAQQTALNLKANLAGPAFTGTLDAVEISVAGNVVVGGNLTVSGTTTSVNTETINLADNIINLNSNHGASTAPTQDAGLQINRGSATDANLYWDEDIDRWSLGLANVAATGASITPDAYIGAVETHATAAPSSAPVYGGSTTGDGTIFVKQNTGDVYIYA